MKTHEVHVGKISIGGSNPIRIQSMTNTDTADVNETVAQIIELADAGSELVRMTVNVPNAAKAVPLIKSILIDRGYGDLPLIGDFHFNGHLLLSRYPECAQSLDKYRINPGNVGLGEKHDEQFSQIIEIALKFNKPVRIGVNWGSLDPDLTTVMMDENAKLGQDAKPDREVLIDAMIASAHQSTELAERLGMPENKIIVSVKMSEVKDCVDVYQSYHQELKERGKSYPLHVGVTEAGSGMKGAIASSSALGILLNQGIGDTIRISLTPTPTSKRSDEVEACKLLLQTMGFRNFKPMVTSCPGCGRTSNTLYQEMAQEVGKYIDERMSEWKIKYPRVVEMKVAVMGCVVNGPGESKYADIGISLPGKTEKPVAPIIVRGKEFTTLKGDSIIQDFKDIIEDFVVNNYS
jgi:(E)-4-hydroxy-3-methylbut-2-enyl-diphosphate synthase